MNAVDKIIVDNTFITLNQVRNSLNDSIKAGSIEGEEVFDTIKSIVDELKAISKKLEKLYE